MIAAVVGEARLTSLAVHIRDYAGPKLEAELQERSDPTSPRYAQHYTVEALRELLDCRPQVVLDHLRTAAPRMPLALSATHDLVTFEPTVEEAMKIFNVSRAVITQPDDAKALAGLPAAVLAEIDTSLGLMLPLDISGQSAPRRRLRAPLGPVYRPNTPADLYQAYNYTPIAKPWAAPAGANSIYMQQGLRIKDVEAFFSKYVPALKGLDPPVAAHGAVHDDWDIEPALDLEWIMPFGRYLPTYYYAYEQNFDDRRIYAALAQWASTLAAQDGAARPWVGSASFGPSAVIPAAQRAADRAFAKAGLRGVTLLSASGDDACNPNQSCETYEVDRPTGPHVTLVGGVACDTTSLAKSAWAGSSGGFSHEYARPVWQAAAVEQYLASQPDLPPAHLYDASKRAGPDISGCANNLVAIDVTGPDAGGGTSFSAPALAGLFSTLNQHRAEAGKAPLGFLNPLLYHLAATCADCFVDITIGANPMSTTDKNHLCPKACGNSSRACGGWQASQGWDPVTGVGMPNFGNLLREVLKLP